MRKPRLTGVAVAGLRLVGSRPLLFLLLSPIYHVIRDAQRRQNEALQLQVLNLSCSVQEVSVPTD